ncbi:MAG: DUF3817 domain-containing protein [Rhizobiaceae bacterium]|nr:DUF3817 domain-containing protein [Rhizobiaceae bacterium]
MSVFRIFLPHIWSNDAPWPSIRTKLGRLRLAGFVEGTTLLVLLLIAVPLKYGLDMPAFVSTMGPIHGLAFVFYFTQAAATVFSGGWTGTEITRTLFLSLVPFGTFMNDGLLHHKEQERSHV